MMIDNLMTELLSSQRDKDKDASPAKSGEGLKKIDFRYLSRSSLSALISHVVSGDGTTL